MLIDELLLTLTKEELELVKSLILTLLETE